MREPKPARAKRSNGLAQIGRTSGALRSRPAVENRTGRFQGSEDLKRIDRRGDGIKRRRRGLLGRCGDGALDAGERVGVIVRKTVLGEVNGAKDKTENRERRDDSGPGTGSLNPVDPPHCPYGSPHCGLPRRADVIISAVTGKETGRGFKDRSLAGGGVNAAAVGLEGISVNGTACWSRTSDLLIHNQAL